MNMLDECSCFEPVTYAKHVLIFYDTQGHASWWRDFLGQFIMHLCWKSCSVYYSNCKTVVTNWSHSPQLTFQYHSLNTLYACSGVEGDSDCPIIFGHQSHWQQYLMELYGSDMCVIEVTVSVVTVKYCGICLKFCVCMFVDLLPSKVVTARRYTVGVTLLTLAVIYLSCVNLTDLKWNS